MIALVWGGTLNSSAANLRTAVKGAASGTLNLRDLRETLRESANQNQRVKEEERNMKKGLVWFGFTNSLNGSFGSEVSVTLKETFPPPPPPAPPPLAISVSLTESSTITTRFVRSSYEALARPVLISPIYNAIGFVYVSIILLSLTLRCCPCILSSLHLIFKIKKLILSIFEISIYNFR